jgi:hypothetical protein
VIGRVSVPTTSAVRARNRISKLMSEQGLCSRREADAYIERGWVFVDGVRVTELGSRALPTQKITYSSKEAEIEPAQRRSPSCSTSRSVTSPARPSRATSLPSS